YTGAVSGTGPLRRRASDLFTTAATAASGVGAYDVTPGGLTSSNYTITFVKGTLDITKAALSVTADADTSTAAVDHFTKTYGDPNPTFTVRYSGLVAADRPGSLGGTLAFTTAATAASGVGAYEDRKSVV